jgi:multidrug efflux pump
MVVTDYAIRFRTAVFVAVLLFGIFGALSYVHLPREGMPDITIPHVFVTAVYEGTAPLEMEQRITIPLEEELNNVEGLKEIRSTSSENVCFIDIEFLAGQDIDQAKQRVKDKVDLARADLPDDLDEPLVQAINVSSDIPVFKCALSGDADLERLTDLAERLQDRIEAVPGVKEAEISGTREREIRVEVDPGRLAAYDIPLGLVMRRIAEENATISAGNIEMAGSKFQVRIPGEFALSSELRRILILERGGSPVYLSDIAAVRDAHKDVESISRLDGATSVSLGVKKRAGENSVAVIGRVKAALAEVPLPSGIRRTDVFDESEYVQEMIGELENNIVTGSLLVLAVLLIFMGGRNSVMVSLAIPLSMLIGFMVLAYLGQSMNMIVLFALVLASGMLVDNAIVIVENIYRHHTQGLSRVRAAIRGAR